MSYKLLIINPGSTSTKIGVFEDETQIMETTLRHSTEEIAKYNSIIDQKDFRKEVILNALKENNIELSSIDGCVGRGGMLKPIPGGTYATSDELIHDLEIGVQGQHASNLGGILAKEIAAEIGDSIPSFIVDPVVVDELAPIARYSGHPLLPRVSVFHALNQKAVAKRYAKETGKNYEDLNLIVVHMGGGVSVGAHKNGKVVDVANALDGDGPFSPERTGGLPSGSLVKLCFSGKYTEAEVKKMISGNGGFNAYLGTNDMRDVLKMANEGNETARAVADAFHYQLCKEIGAMAVVLGGKVDQIILTGGIAYGKETVDTMTAQVNWIADVTVYPGEDELLALAQGGLRVMNGDEKALEY
ncbi:MAG: butyrate kinase [Lachnospiraceae bacterium]|nr:butyrate kinase [Lachnospiraceae bacterium]